MKKTVKYLVTFFLCLSIPFSFAEVQQQSPKVTLIFGTQINSQPFSSLDASGSVYGFSIVFARMICSELQANCLFKPMPFSELFDALKTGEIDAAIGGISITDERKQDFDFTLPYLPTKASILAAYHPGQKPLKQMTQSAARNKIFAAQKHSAFEQVMKKFFPNLNVKEYEHMDDIINALAQNEVDYALLDTPVAHYWENQSPRRLYVVGKPYDLQIGIGIMINKNKPLLRAKMNAAILSITRSNTYAELLKTFFPMDNP